MNTKALRIADALEKCDWAGCPIGNKEILRAAVEELRLSTLPIAGEGKEGWQLVPVKPTEAMIEEANECEASWKSIWPAMLAAAPVPPSSTECAARRQGTTGGNDPADCNWPFCGCDPHADKVIAAIEESGMSALISSPGKDGGQEPVLFVSEQQLPACIGTYLPTRKNREGNFQMPLYTRPQPASTALVERLTEELTAAASLLETLSEELPDDDVSGVMMRVMAERNRSALSAQSTSTEGESRG